MVRGSSKSSIIDFSIEYIKGEALLIYMLVQAS